MEVFEVKDKSGNEVASMAIDMHPSINQQLMAETGYSSPAAITLNDGLRSRTPASKVMRILCETSSVGGFEVTCSTADAG